MDTDNSVVMAVVGGGGEGWVDWGRAGENRDICNSVNNKNKI